MHPLLAWLVFAMLIAALLLAFVRLMLGPSLPDRVVALDLMAMIMGGIMLVSAVVTGVGALVDAVVILALIVFFGTVAFARYLERQITK